MCLTRETIINIQTDKLTSESRKSHGNIRMSERRLISRATMVFRWGRSEVTSGLFIDLRLISKRAIFNFLILAFRLIFLSSIYFSFACPGSRYSTISTGKLLLYVLTSCTFVCKVVEKLIQPSVKQMLCQTVKSRGGGLCQEFKPFWNWLGMRKGPGVVSSLL